MVLFCTVTSMNAQQLLKGDMNDDGDLTVEDVTTLVDMVMGRQAPIPIENPGIGMFEIDNTGLYGTWETSDNESIVIFDETEATYNAKKYSYQYYPNLQKLILSDKDSGKTEVMLYVEKMSDSQIRIFDNKVGDFVEYLLSNKVKVESITLSQTTLELKAGNVSEPIMATVTPEDARQIVIWSSSDEALATVENGVITAIAPGMVTITCAATDGSEVTASCEVTITQQTLITEITLSPSSLDLEVNNTETIEFSVLPEDASNKEVTWSSNAEAVATVENGVVTAVAPGTATITCASTDGSRVNATCEVTVSPKVILVMGITLSQSSIKLKTGNTQTIEATVTPEYASNKEVTWSSSAEAVATVEDGVVTAVAAGTAIITCTATDDSGVSATCEVTVPVEHKYVDLGLTSGTLWATCNLGAEDPADMGYYFAWGETEPKTTYNWSTYAHCNGTNTSFTKYCQANDIWAGGGMPDGLTILQSEDDAATQLWGDEWCMPTSGQLAELNDCRKEYTSRQYNGKTIYGIKFYNRISGSPTLFLPISGIVKNETTTYDNGYYWANNASKDVKGSSFYISVEDGVITAMKIINTQNRCYGMTIRPVRK